MKRDKFEDDYDSSIDIENGRVMLSFPDYNSISCYSERVIKKLDETVKRAQFENLRITNSISILLLITFYFITVLRLNNNNFYILIDKIRQENLYSEFNLYVLYLAFLFVTCI